MNGIGSHTHFPRDNNVENALAIRPKNGVKLCNGISHRWEELHWRYCNDGKDKSKLHPLGNSLTSIHHWGCARNHAIFEMVMSKKILQATQKTTGISQFVKFQMQWMNKDKLSEFNANFKFILMNSNAWKFLSRKINLNLGWSFESKAHCLIYRVRVLSLSSPTHSVYVDFIQFNWIINV